MLAAPSSSRSSQSLSRPSQISLAPAWVAGSVSSQSTPRGPPQRTSAARSPSSSSRSPGPAAKSAAPSQSSSIALHASGAAGLRALAPSSQSVPRSERDGIGAHDGIASRASPNPSPSASAYQRTSAASSSIAPSQSLS